MTIDDKIGVEKLQFDINKEAAKISALSPGNQRQIIERAKFAYSPLGNTFKNQTKMIEDQGEKQIKAIEDNEKQLDNKKQLGNNELLLSEEREIFKNNYNERLDKIDELSKKTDYQF